MKAFRYDTPAGPYWTVIDDDGDYREVPVADGFLQHLRFSRGKSVGTTRKYAEGLALYFGYAKARNADWAEPDMTAFQLWLRVTPGPREQRTSRQSYAGPGAKPLRNNNTIDGICIAVCEMMKFAAAEGQVNANVVRRLYELATTAHLPAALKGEREPLQLLIRRRHTLPRTRPQGHNVPIPVVLELLAACRNARDRLLLITLGIAGLRRGEAVGLRLSDLHLLPDNRAIRCGSAGAHLHVVRRHNSNDASAKQGDREVPLAAAFVIAYDLYRVERDAVARAAQSDYLFVNLWRAPLGDPMKLHAVNELLKRLSRHVGQEVTPHMLRHTFATEALQVSGIDVVQLLLGHATMASTQVYLHPDEARQRDAVERSALAVALVEPEGPQ